MECMPLRSPPGAYHYHVNDQTKSLQVRFHLRNTAHISLSVSINHCSRPKQKKKTVRLSWAHRKKKRKNKFITKSKWHVIVRVHWMQSHQLWHRQFHLWPFIRLMQLKPSPEKSCTANHSTNKWHISFFTVFLSIFLCVVVDIVSVVFVFLRSLCVHVCVCVCCCCATARLTFRFQFKGSWSLIAILHRKTNK